MNTFFYAATAPACHNNSDSGCDYASCSRRCLSLLESLPRLAGLNILQPGSCLKTVGSMAARSGDIMILYAACDKDIDFLLEIREHFDPYRVILVAGGKHLIDGRHYSLAPRYTISLDQDLSQLEDVLARMNAQPKTMPAPGKNQRGQSHA